MGMLSTTDYQALSKAQIAVLKKNGCTCRNWSRVEVADKFDPARLQRVEFCGNVRLGCFEAEESGVSDARLVDCQLLDNSQVRSVTIEIRGYVIGKDAKVCGIQALRMGEGEHRFANGLPVEVVIESGGREVVIHENLTVQEAYLQAFCDDQQVLEKLRDFSQREKIDQGTVFGTVGYGAVIEGCGIIENTAVLKGATICGATKISNSTIAGNVGAGSVVSDSIVAAGGNIGEGCVVDRCFVGDGASLGKGFSAENSLFFAGSECLRGEACSVFAGPFTVSHHKSTLLLAGLYSFYNAGSGTNFSNHRYKLGPVHQGVLERGCKSGSGSYQLWPSHTAAFTSVIGKHLRSLDTSAFPFSLLLEQGGKSVLLPGANLFTIGLERDLQKWPKRDKRSGNPVDVLNFNGYSPYTLERVVAAQKLLKKLHKHYQKHAPVLCADFVIPQDYLEKGLARYHAVLNFYYGNVVATCLEQGSKFKPAKQQEKNWFDLAGLLLPDYAYSQLHKDIASGMLDHPKKLQERLQQEHTNYSRYEECWVIASAGLPHKPDSDKKGRALLDEILTNWMEAAKLREDMLLRDMAKEYTPQMQTGFGLLGERETDFLFRRGKVEQHPLVQQIREETGMICKRAEKLLKRN